MATVAELFSLAWKHHQAGGVAQAEQLYRQVLQIDPTYADAWCFLGAACQAQGKLAEAESDFRQAVQLIPTFAGAHNWLGMLLAQQGRLAEAVASFRQGLTAQPNNVELLNNLGLALTRQGRLAEAVNSYQQALRLSPGYAGAHYNLGLALNAQGQHDEAIAQFQQALQILPQYPEAWNDLGNVLAQKERLAESADCYEKALNIRPDYAEALYNLGVVLVKQSRAEEAITHYRRACAAKPDYADAHFNLANTLHGLGRMEEALSQFLEALRLRPDHPETNLSCALVWLILGDFERGWPAYDWREKQPDVTPRAFSQPRWDGSPLNGRTILIHAELGLGDTLQFIRFAPLVKQRGGKVIVECQASLCRLMTGVAGADQLIPRNSPSPVFDVHTPLLSLPAILGTSLTNIPATIPYLHADWRLVKQWQRNLTPMDGGRTTENGVRCQSDSLSTVHRPPSTFHVGIAWQGNLQYGHDKQRSIPLAEFAPLAKVPGIRLVSLQKGAGLEQLRIQETQVDSLLQSTIHNLQSAIFTPLLDESTGAFMDTAAVMKCLDLVVTSDTAIAHLAGALGVPVWVALPGVPDWRWLLEREDSPWYPTMRLFRQDNQGDWRAVFDRIAEEIKKRMEEKDEG